MSAQEFYFKKKFACRDFFRQDFVLTSCPYVYEDAISLVESWLTNFAVVCSCRLKLNYLQSILMLFSFRCIFLSFLELVQETEIQVATKVPKPWDTCAMLLRITTISKPNSKQTMPTYVYTGDRFWLPRDHGPSWVSTGTCWQSAKGNWSGKYFPKGNPV